MLGPMSVPPADPAPAAPAAPPARRPEARPVVGLLQCGPTPEELEGEHGDYADMFRDLLGRDRFDFVHHRVFDGDVPADPFACDAWCLTGSRHGAYEPHGWIPPLEALVRGAYAAAVPLVGVCFGHQLVAQALGGRVEKFRGGWSVGRVAYRFDAGAGLPGLDGRELAVAAYHQDQVLEPPPGARTIASSDFCRHAALVYCARALTVQPHPEVDEAFLAGLVATRGLALPPETLARARASLGPALERAPVGEALARFLADGIAARRGA